MHGQLGLCGQFEESSLNLPKMCSYNVVIKSISCGQNHSLFASDSGHVYSMGSNSHGQLGQKDKSIKSKNTPTLVDSLVELFIKKISCGNEHTLALSENGEAFAWGNG